MVKSSYFLFIWLLPLCLYGNSPKNKDTINVLNSIHNILYISIDNPIKIVQEDVSFKNLYVTSNNGKLIRKEDHFVAIPQKKVSTKLHVHKVTPEDTVSLKIKELTTIYLPDPVVTMNNKKMTGQDKISKEFLLKCDSVGIYFSDDITTSQNWFEIEGFRLGYFYGSHYLSINNKGAKIQSKIKDRIRKIPQGHKITIHVQLKADNNIAIKGPTFRSKLY